MWKDVVVARLETLLRKREKLGKSSFRTAVREPRFKTSALMFLRYHDKKKLKLNG
jgi:hypothetical protein